MSAAAAGVDEELAGQTLLRVGDLVVDVVASPSPLAVEVFEACMSRWGAAPDGAAAQVRLALGGDGCVLRCLQMSVADAAVTYGANCGTVGFLCNPLDPSGDCPPNGAPGRFAAALADRLAAAHSTRLCVLDVGVTGIDGAHTQAVAINDVALWCAGPQAVKLRVLVDGKVRMEELVGDGLVVATPAGSTGYNLSARGPILPLDSSVLACTPLNPYSPRRWPGALLPDRAVVSVSW